MCAELQRNSKRQARKPRAAAAEKPGARSSWNYRTCFRTLVEHASDGMALLDAGGAVLYASQVTAGLFGLPHADLQGRAITDFACEEDVLRTQTLLEWVRDTSGRSSSAEIRLRKPDGSQRWVEITATNQLSNTRVAAIVATYRDIDARKRLEDKWKSLAFTDSLTGLKNYRGLAEALERELRRSERTRRPFVVLLIDLDGLKRINDAQGHLAGNQAICRVAQAIQKECRSIDTCARYGGDEFAMLLPETAMDGSLVLMSRIDDRLAEITTPPLTSVSIGASEFPKDGKNCEELLKAADGRLYERKALLLRA